MHLQAKYFQRFSLGIFLSLCALLQNLQSQDAPSQPELTKPNATSWSEDVKPFLTRYCAECHSGDGAEAGIDFEKYASDAQLPEERPRWDQIRGMIEIGAMPPADHTTQPTREQREMIANWIDRRINSVDCNVIQDPGRVTMRRLNNVEYDNSIRDLLGLEGFSPSAAAGFPSDDVGNGFDNQGDVLGMSQLQMEKYLEAASIIADRALLPPSTYERRSYELPALFLGDQQEVRAEFLDGKYEIKARLQFAEVEKQEVEVHLLIDDDKVDSFDVVNKRASFVTDVEMKAGWHSIQLKFAYDPGADEKKRDRRVEVESLNITGPPPVPASYARLLRVQPSETVTPEQAARENLEPILRAAYRREPEPIDVQRVVTLFRIAMDQGMSFEKAIGVGLQAVLVSPHFLFRVEREQAGVGLDQYVLASRLSYFLWASIPDAELLDLARDQKLADPLVLQAQARRMLADSRSESLVKRFFGQYLGLGNLQTVDPDSQRFRIWNDQLREAIQRETEMFCHAIVKEDMPLDTLVQGDFTFINPRLAEFYGVVFEGVSPSELYLQGPGINRPREDSRNGKYLHENRWIRVPAPANRRGVLTHASILTLTSNPTLTSPVKRGKWILETLLGDPPPPAPPNVPTLEETQKDHANVSLREQLAIHRANPSCASCHNVMDPLGLGFENFDAIGRWRDKDGEHLVDATGSLRDGKTFSGSVELVQLLAERQPEIYRYFSEKLLTYALGRGLEPYDKCAIDAILESASKQGYTMSSFVSGVVTSQPFTKRRPDGDNTVANAEN
jgi:PAS domain-containing protein